MKAEPLTCAVCHGHAEKGRAVREPHRLPGLRPCNAKLHAPCALPGASRGGPFVPHDGDTTRRDPRSRRTGLQRLFLLLVLFLPVLLLLVLLLLVPLLLVPLLHVQLWHAPLLTYRS